MPLPQVGDWVGFPGGNKRLPGQWFWGKVVKREFYGDKWHLVLDTGSGGLRYFYLDELIIPSAPKTEEIRDAIQKVAGKLKE